MSKESRVCTVEPPHAHLLAVPSELLIKDILSCLPISSLSACSQTCKFLNCLISSSLLLTYFKELTIAGMLHNPRCTYETYPISKRLDMLREKERRWLYLRPKWRRQVGISVAQDSYDTHGIVPGHVLLGTNFDVVGAVASIRLPNEWDGEVHWKLANIGQHIINFGVALEEHNLIACLTCTNPNQPSSFQVHLFNHSTGEHHSSASMPIIRVPMPHLQPGEVWGDISVCGENLAVSVKYPITTDPTFIRRLHIWNWESGILKAKFELESECLQGLGTPGLTFLREDILLNPNAVVNSLDVYHIPHTPLVFDSSVRMIARFDLPKLSKHFQEYLLQCHLSPSPCFSPAHCHTSSEKPFMNNPESSILELAFHVLKNERWNMSCLLIRWQYLLSHSLKHRVEVEINERLRTDTSCLICRWDEWGPQNSRLFPERPRCPSIMSTNGSRWVSLTKNINRSSKGSQANLSRKIEVYDFNRVRSTLVVQLTTQEDNENDNDDNSPFVELVGSPSVYPTPNDSFAESVDTHLPYLRTTYRLSNPGFGNGLFKNKQKKLDEWIKNKFRRHRQGSASHSAEGSSATVGEADPVRKSPPRPDLCSWDGILVDDERIVGLMFDAGEDYNELDILYLG